MYVIINDGLPPGAQAAQAVHAAFDFCYEHPRLAYDWHEDSNYLVLLAAPSEADLLVLARRAHDANLAYTLIREPDYNDQVTAIVLAAGLTARRLCSNLPLALREETKV